MSIRTVVNPALESIAAVGRDILSKVYAILGQVAKLATSEEVTLLRADLSRAIESNEVDLSPVLTTQATNKAEILAAITASAGAGAAKGELRLFPKAQIPSGWRSVADSPLYPSKGNLYSMGNYTQNYSAGVYVAEGTGAGFWAVQYNSIQRVDFDTSAAVGPVYTIPGTRTLTQTLPFVVSVGKYLYIGGSGYTANSVTTYSPEFWRVDTETGGLLRLVNLPRGVSFASAVVLSGRWLLINANATQGVAQTVGASLFYLYDLTTNATPTEFTVALPLTNLTNVGRQMAVMPSGRVMLIDSTDSGSVNRLSCLLTVGPTGITAGPAEDTGLTGMTGYAAALMETSAGAHLWNSSVGGVVRTYVEGTGWMDATLPIVRRTGTTGLTASQSIMYCSPLPGYTGWFIMHNTAGAYRQAYLVTASPYAVPNMIVYAQKL